MKGDVGLLTFGPDIWHGSRERDHTRAREQIAPVKEEGASEVGAIVRACAKEDRTVLSVLLGLLRIGVYDFVLLLIWMEMERKKMVGLCRIHPMTNIKY